MESASERSGDGGSGLNEEKRSEHSIGDDENHHHKQDTLVEVKINSLLLLLKCHQF